MRMKEEGRRGGREGEEKRDREELIKGDEKGAGGSRGDAE